MRVATQEMVDLVKENYKLEKTLKDNKKEMANTLSEVEDIVSMLLWKFYGYEELAHNVEILRLHSTPRYNKVGEGVYIQEKVGIRNGMLTYEVKKLYAMDDSIYIFIACEGCKSMEKLNYKDEEITKNSELQKLVKRYIKEEELRDTAEDKYKKNIQEFERLAGISQELITETVKKLLKEELIEMGEYRDSRDCKYYDSDKGCGACESYDEHKGCIASEKAAENIKLNIVDEEIKFDKNNKHSLFNVRQVIGNMIEIQNYVAVPHDLYVSSKSKEKKKIEKAYIVSKKTILI